jgi:hypothetical protein
MRQRSPDYINLWFKWQWISVASRIVRAIATGLYIVIGLVVRGGWLGRDTVSVSISGTSAG